MYIVNELNAHPSRWVFSSVKDLLEGIIKLWLHRLSQSLNKLAMNLDISKDNEKAAFSLFFLFY